MVFIKIIVIFILFIAQMDKDNLIDSDNITKFNPDIVIKNGFSFGPVTRLVSGVLIVFGALAIISGGGGYFLGPIICLAALFASSYGAEISLSNNYIREYTSTFGFKTGKWVSTIGLPDIAVMKLGKTRGVANIRTGGTAFEVDASANEVYLLSANHRKRVLVKVCQSRSDGVEFATQLAKQMGKNFVPFNPSVSEKSKARR